MFGFSKLWAAVSRLAASVHTTADLWDAANERLRERLNLTDGPETKPASSELTCQERTPENGKVAAERLEKYAKTARNRR